MTTLNHPDAELFDPAAGNYQGWVYPFPSGFVKGAARVGLFTIRVLEYPCLALRAAFWTLRAAFWNDKPHFLAIAEI
jgi:hypothetical protein